MISTIITALVGLLCTLASSIVTFLLTKRKYDIEVDTQQIENMSKSFDVYKKTMNETFAMQNSRIAMQEETIKQLQMDNNDLRKQVHNLQMQMAQMFNAVCYDTTCKLRKASFPIEMITESIHDNTK